MVKAAKGKSSKSKKSLKENNCLACGKLISVVNLDSKTEGGINRYPKHTKSTVVLCDACKKFYFRYRGKIEGKSCTCSGDSSTPENKCRLCRYQRCQAALFEKVPTPGKKFDAGQSEPEVPLNRVNFSKLPCTICGCSSSGFHFGVLSCEGCKVFFRRTVNRNFKGKYVCKNANDEGRLCSPNSNCRKCRYQRCIDAGMSTKEVAIGRHSIRRRAEVNAALRRHMAAGSLLSSQVCRRDVTVVEEGEAPQDERNVLKDEPESTRPSSRSRKRETPKKISKKVDKDLPSTSSVVHMEMATEESESNLELSTDQLIERTVEAATKLMPISTMRLALNNKMTLEQIINERYRFLGEYAQFIAEFVMALPGIGKISSVDRILLFTQSFFAVSVAQLLRNFDTEKQVPNHFSLDRKGPAWDICAKEFPSGHASIERHLCEAGNRLSTAVRNLQEFALFCTLLLINSATPNIENVESVRSARRRFEMALFHCLSKNADDSQLEKRVGGIYELLSYFRQISQTIRELFLESVVKQPGDKSAWSPLPAPVLKLLSKTIPK